MKATELRNTANNYPNVLYAQIIKKCTERAILGEHQHIMYVAVPTETVEKLKNEGFIVQLMHNNSGIMASW